MCLPVLPLWLVNKAAMIIACLLARARRLPCRSRDVRAAVQQCLRCTVTPVMECGWQFRPVGRQVRMF
jgi:hypothetical protein